MKRFLIIAVIALLNVGWISAQEKIKWLEITDAMQKRQNEPRKIIVDVYTSWCGWCKVMDRTTYKDTNIIKYINENYYAVKFDAEQREDITLGDQTFKYVASGSRGYHELAAALLNGKMGYPSTVIIDEENNIIQIKQGYLKPRQFDEFINFFGGNHYKTLNYQEFLEKYKSPVPES